MPAKTILSLLLCSFVSASLFAAETSPDAAQLVATMGDRKLSQAQRDAAAGELATMGKAAMPALIDSLHDNRVYYPHYEEPTGANGPVSGVDLTVGQECNTILMDIVSNGASTKGIGFKYKIADWPGWWTAHKEMSQQAMQKEVKKRNQFIMESTGQGDSIPHINQP
jgi:hypothetical protein